MKKLFIEIMLLGMLGLTACANKAENPGEPPKDVVGENDVSGGNKENNQNQTYEGEMLSNAVTARIGVDGDEEWGIDMYNIPVSLTMLDYLTASEMRFPTYTYDEEQGYVAQNIRGSYSRDYEETIADVHVGELYLFSDGQLRLYFKDIIGANITATPVGRYEVTENLPETIMKAYEENRGDTWNVDVYFLLKKNI